MPKCLWKSQAFTGNTARNIVENHFLFLRKSRNLTSIMPQKWISLVLSWQCIWLYQGLKVLFWVRSLSHLEACLPLSESRVPSSDPSNTPSTVARPTRYFRSSACLRAACDCWGTRNAHGRYRRGWTARVRLFAWQAARYAAVSSSFFLPGIPALLVVFRAPYGHYH